MPRPDDQLWIVTDGSVKHTGLGATLYVTRANKTLLSGYFSAKLRKTQAHWLPCEIEALSIAASIKHFSPYIIQSSNQTCILTDSKPCVQAFEKLCRGQFSASPRLLTFLSTASRYHVSIRHVAGSTILPTDFASRHAPDCDNFTCQICSFVQQIEDSVARQITIGDIQNGSFKLPFTSRPTWLSIQSECPDLRRTCAHLRQGTRPSKKLTNIRDVKRYLNVVTLAKDGLLVVKRDVPFEQSRECIVVPRTILNGLLTALHVKLNHPSAHQMKTVIHRYFFALDMDKTIDDTTNSCHHCASLKQLPKTVTPQSTSEPPESIGYQFSADVMRRERQFIFVLRETVTSYTVAKLIDDERRDTLRNTLLELALDLVPLDGPSAVVRTDAAPGFVALGDDDLLNRYNIVIEVGRTKNSNKNPVAERAIQELELEIKKQDPTCRALTPLMLAIAIARLNTRVRHQGLSSREMWTMRDQFSNKRISIDDCALILRQHEHRIRNHGPSEHSKNPNNLAVNPVDISVGDIVYLRQDGTKHRRRDRYLVVFVDNNWCNVRKFVGSQLRQSSYRVKKTECYKVQGYNCARDNIPDSDEDDEEDIPPTPPTPPDIPTDISDHTLHDNHEQVVPLPEPLRDGNTEHVHELSTDDSVNDTPAVSRPRRNRTRPKRLDDYILD